MTTIRVIAQTALDPDQVLAAARDFSSRREQVFPAVSMDRMEVHGLDGTTADVTEGTSTGIGSNWERCDYDWSADGIITATVTDSNVYATPGSRWEITARPNASGSEVEMVWIRTFKGGLRGRLFGTAFRLFGSRIFRGYGHEVIENLEKLEASAGSPES
ncbi:MAG TPA: SRPBCC family protein [Solirubrobacterales bacterium]